MKPMDGPAPRQGWTWAAFEDVVENHDKRRVPIKRAARAVREGRYPYYGASGIIDTIDEYLFSGDYLLIAEDGANLLSRSTPIAFTAHGKFWVNNHAHVVTTRGRIPLGFLAAYLNTIDLSQRITGTAQPKLTQAALNRVPVPVPPFNEQTRIVDAIETQLTRLDAAVAALERVQANLKRYRASVLKAAVEGRFVPTEAELARREGRDYEPASVLLQGILAERRHRWEESELAAMRAKGRVPKDERWKARFVQPAAPDSEGVSNMPLGWCLASLEQLVKGEKHAIKAGPFLSALRKEMYVASGYKVYGQEQVIRQDHRYGDYFINERTYTSLSSCAVRPGDILISLVGTIGRMLVLPSDAAPGIINPRLVKLSFDSELISPQYFGIYFGSPSVREVLTQSSQGATMNVLNLSILKRLAVPLPPRSEQDRIVAEIERQQSVISNVVRGAGDSIDRGARLRQSILRFAFEGRLVDQDPNDEPASVLLDRIRAEREASQKTHAETKRNAQGKGRARERRARAKAPEA